MRRDLLAIREELHCTAVILIGAELTTAAEYALEIGLDVWIRPHLLDRSWDDVLAHLERVAEDAEQLRLRYPGRLTLLVGSEFSHTARGMVPGSWAYLRLMIIMRANWSRFDLSGLATVRGSASDGEQARSNVCTIVDGEGTQLVRRKPSFAGWEPVFCFGSVRGELRRDVK